MTQIQGPSSEPVGESATEALVEPPRSPRLAQNEPLDHMHTWMTTGDGRQKCVTRSCGHLHAGRIAKAWAV